MMINDTLLLIHLPLGEKLNRREKEVIEGEVNGRVGK
ncbi:hypothetical protein OCC_13775 [Thermococcus litoralis DSM 5473]|uniref:Uncharacterized protein n=1 Tax=Thermococcus litoralis (strain ATCC 51850 / DSM 5473 / JCM 8560 / NS-C) TaxID=523849 RepID=S6A4I6_THELN|nr:hypothetical protein OCC_13775 [Thermococcus litoralis DSM 5473]